MDNQEQQATQETKKILQQVGQHDDETVPHKISDHEKLVQTSVMVDGDWININNTLDQMNLKIDLHKVAKVVEAQVDQIADVESNANSAVKQAESAQEASNTNKAAIANVDSAVKATQQEVSDAVANVNDANKNITKINTDLKAVQTDIAGQSAAVGTIQADLSAAKQQIKDAEGNITAVNQTAQSAYSIASDANSNAVEVKQTAQSAYAVATDAKSNITQVKVTADSAMTLATNAKSDAAEAKVTANGISTTVTGLGSQVQSLSDATKAVSDNMKNKADKGTVDQAVSKLTTSINQAKDGLTSKADKLDIDKLTKSVTDTQTLLNQKAGELSSTITRVSNKAGQNTVLISNLTQTVDGMQSTVKNKADQSTVSQLANQMLAKVSTKDFQAEIALMQKNLNLRISKGDLISQLNLEAGGNGLIQVANGKGRLMLDADKVVFGNKAFIPSAAITDIQADKITSGTLDAGMLRVVNLTADSIHGGTLDVGDMHVKNFSANDIETGTLSGVTIRAGDTTDFFQTSQDNIYWITNNGRQSALIGRGEYVTFPGLNIFDSHAIHLGTWAGADLENGTIKDTGGSLGHPKFNIELPADSAFDLLSKNGEMGSTMVPLDNSRISGWVGQKEFFSLEQTQGFHTELNPDLNTSQFRIQKNEHIGAYFGEGNNGNQITFKCGGNDGGFNVNASQTTFNCGGFNVNTSQITFNCGGNDGGLSVNGNFHATGSKNSIVETRQGYLAINAYETAEYYFGDIGENNTGDTSQVVIGIDQIFNEVVNTDIQYQVFVTPYSNAHVWVEKRYNNRFIVKSDRPNAEFGWELKAKRKGYESNRLRRVNVDFNQMDLKGEN